MWAAWNIKLFGLDKCENIDLVLIICDVPNVWKIVYMLIDYKTTIHAPIGNNHFGTKTDTVIHCGTNTAFEMMPENNHF